MKYIKQLDALRAIAVILVLINHWFPGGHFLNKWTHEEIGPIGVDMFFVLSGFLISGILLSNKIEAERDGFKKSTIIKSFFIRRVIRIFPIYYLTLLIAWIFVNRSELTGFIYYLTYTGNFYIYQTQKWGPLTHLWSVAVEEQFYLFWPWLLLFINRRYLLSAIVLFILTGVISHMLLGASHFDSIVTYTCFDALGMGALLAWIRFYRPEKLGKTYQVLSILAPLSIVLLVISWYRIEWTVLPHRTLTAIVTLWIITHIIYNEPKGKLWFSVILNNGVLIFIGKISYGMYLYHNFVPYFTKRFFVEFNKRLPVLPFQPKVILAFEYFCLVVIMAWLSWKFIETPILHLKKYFVYTPQKTKVPRSKRLSDISI